MDILDTNATQFRRKRGRPPKNPQPSPQESPQPSPQPQQESPQPNPQPEQAAPISGTSDTFEAVAASIAPVIGDGTATPGEPTPGVVAVNPADEKINTLLAGLTPANVEKYTTAIFAGVARGFKMPELELAEHEKPILCPALQVIAERQLPEILKALANKYGDTAPEYALVATFVVMYASRIALAQASKEKKPKDGEKPWGKQTTEKREDTLPQPVPVKPWGRSEASTVGTAGDSMTPVYQALPDSSDNPEPAKAI